MTPGSGAWNRGQPTAWTCQMALSGFLKDDVVTSITSWNVPARSTGAIGKLGLHFITLSRLRVLGDVH